MSEVYAGLDVSDKMTHVYVVGHEYGDGVPTTNPSWHNKAGREGFR